MQMILQRRERRIVFGGLIVAARLVGVLLIGVAVLELPAMRPVVGRYADLFGFVGSIALLLVGIVWLISVRMLIRFFDDYFSRN